MLGLIVIGLLLIELSIVINHMIEDMETFRALQTWMSSTMRTLTSGMLSLNNVKSMIDSINL
jgi:hypothetical protein